MSNRFLNQSQRYFYGRFFIQIALRKIWLKSEGVVRQISRSAR